jgi:hypothetical protein
MPPQHRWTAGDRRRYAPAAIQKVARQGRLVRLAVTTDPPSPAGRPRVWPTPAMPRALRHVARDGRAWRRAVLDRALRVPAACRRLAAGRKRRPTAAITTDAQGAATGPRGYDAHKKVEGRKRVLMIDVQCDPPGGAGGAGRGAGPRCAPRPRPRSRPPCLPAAGLAGPRLRRR